ncbi:hypothetical protein LZ31DRAFT_551198 [Colletotrichum somersetense]|nr:hypothetical protein LZ31DRAFT_551198 [Colletotrichum somersetense]
MDRRFAMLHRRQGESGQGGKQKTPRKGGQGALSFAGGRESERVRESERERKRHFRNSGGSGSRTMPGRLGINVWRWRGGGRLAPTDRTKCESAVERACQTASQLPQRTLDTGSQVSVNNRCKSRVPTSQRYSLLVACYLKTGGLGASGVARSAQ